MSYVTAYRLTWLALVGIGLVLSLFFPGHVVAILGSAVAAGASFLLYPRQPWWGYVPSEPIDSPPAISVWRSTAVYLVAFGLMAIAIGAGWVIEELVRFEV